METERPLDTDKLDREGALLGKIIYWAIVVVLAGVAVFGTVAVATRKVYFHTPAIFMLIFTVAVWIGVGVMAFYGLKKRERL